MNVWSSSYENRSLACQLAGWLAGWLRHGSNISSQYHPSEFDFPVTMQSSTPLGSADFTCTLSHLLYPWFTCSDVLLICCDLLLAVSIYCPSVGLSHRKLSQRRGPQKRRSQSMINGRVEGSGGRIGETTKLLRLRALKHFRCITHIQQ